MVIQLQPHLFDPAPFDESSVGQLLRITRRLQYRTQYLQSWQWARRRIEFLDRHPDCEVCGRRATDVHHTSYDHVGDESDDELMPLCRRHHDEAHPRTGRRRDRRHPGPSGPGR